MTNKENKYSSHGKKRSVIKVQVEIFVKFKYSYLGSFKCFCSFSFFIEIKMMNMTLYTHQKNKKSVFIAIRGGVVHGQE